MHKQVVVIGGGIGGLTAGALLAKHDYEVTVLEASENGEAVQGNFSAICIRFLLGRRLEWDLSTEGYMSESARTLA